MPDETKSATGVAQEQLNTDTVRIGDLPSGRPDPLAPPAPAPVDTMQSVREAAAALLSPEALDNAVAAALERAAPTNEHLALIGELQAHLSAVIGWAHDLFDMFNDHFSGKLPMPNPPPKPGAGIGQ